LFPVISASDDLHAMRAEMEESASKRTVRHAAGDRSSPSVNRMQGLAAMRASSVWLGIHEVGLLEVAVSSLLSSDRPCILHAGRAPPFSFLA
jgi:hypothetical protein